MQIFQYFYSYFVLFLTFVYKKQGWRITAAASVRIVLDLFPEDLFNLKN